jgi:twitching motility protein PilT
LEPTNNDELNFGFKEKDPEKAIQELNAKLGCNNGWFIQLIKEITEYGSKITDIVIKEGQVIKVGKLKGLVPLEMKFGGNSVFKPTAQDIKSVALAFGKESHLGTSMSSIDFSVAAFGIGVFRFNYSKDMSGLRQCIRCLDFDIPEFESHKYPNSYKRIFNNLVRETVETGKDGKERRIGMLSGGGLILHVGPTGSGKTTAISSEIRMLADKISGTILTYENPIEYRILKSKADVSQYELGRHIFPQNGRSLSQTVKDHLLRNNPSVAMISEVKSEEEIYDMFDTAGRGHLVFSTMHARNTEEALSLALSIMKDSRHKIATSLLAIVSHHLHLTVNGGRIIPVYETFIPDDIVKQKISEGKLNDVKRQLYKDKPEGSKSQTFEEYISWLHESKTISTDERAEITTAMGQAIVKRSEIL